MLKKTITDPNTRQEDEAGGHSDHKESILQLECELLDKRELRVRISTFAGSALYTNEAVCGVKLT